MQRQECMDAYCPLVAIRGGLCPGGLPNRGPPWTETSRDRDPPDRDPPVMWPVVHAGTEFFDTHLWKHYLAATSLWAVVSRCSLYYNIAVIDFDAKKSAHIKQMLVVGGKQYNLSVKIILCRCMSFLFAFRIELQWTFFRTASGHSFERLYSIPFSHGRN